jgi:cyclophilin family peptidyl-prolyl cis-trans isomerase
MEARPVAPSSTVGATWAPKTIEAAAARDGTIDLAAIFPSLWKQSEPRLMYAQLVIGGKKVGPAVVLQPLVSPAYAPRLDRSGAPMFPADKERARVYSGIRAYVDKDVALDTSKGRMLIELRPEAAPNTCWRFRELVEGGLYTDVLVHRIASLAGKPEADIIQTGDPNGNGQGGTGEFVDLEASPLPHDFGVVSMARFSDPNSGSSQFMIGLNREGTAYLDKRYTSFGVLIAGADVLRSIAATPVGADNRPTDPPVIRKATLTDAAPYGDGPPPEQDPVGRSNRR